MIGIPTDLPHTVATVTTPVDLDYLSGGGQSRADVLEYRLDNLCPTAAEDSAALDQVLSLAQSLRDQQPALLTARDPAEGGVGDLSLDQRLSIYQAIMASSDLIDIEVANLAVAQARLDFADFSGQLVGSFHDFSGFPGIVKLRDRVDAAYAAGADIAKLAVVVETFGQLYELTDLVLEHRSAGRAISAMGMGPLGQLSRLVLAKAGSCLNYGYLQTENAPGQWPANQLRDLISSI